MCASTQGIVITRSPLTTKKRRRPVGDLRVLLIGELRVLYFTIMYEISLLSIDGLSENAKFTKKSTLQYNYSTVFTHY